MHWLVRSAITGFLLSSGLSGQDQTLATPRTFPEIKSRAEWEERAKEIRQQVLVSCGLWPMPEKTPLKATVFGKVEREGYSIEKVHLQPYPGFYLGGNLYRPLGKGEGPFPAILNPHGHWENGRMADTADGSIAARCISFARQGMIAFSYDMVGYNDTTFAGASLATLHRGYGTQRADELWGINLMGLQTWNSIRALDFLERLPDVDRKRLACTGESGGGTQTFMLGAIDDRLAAQMPVVMVSHTMQGGCNCENAPGLRILHSNMELAAAAAPRPQLLVAATGDWTKTTMEVEGPAIAGIYKLFGAGDRLKYQRFDFPHNYNRTSREAVYAWLGKQFLGQADPAERKEQPYEKEPDEGLRVFPDGKLPEDALSMEQFIEARKEARRAQWRALVPADAEGFERFKTAMLPAWRYTLQTQWSPADKARKDVPPAEETARQPSSLQSTVVLRLGVARVPGSESPFQIEQHDRATILSYASRKGEEEKQDEFSDYFTTYNRTALQNQVRGLMVIAHMHRSNPRVERVILIAHGSHGIAALMAAPAFDGVAVDCGGRDYANDEDLLAPGLFAPGLRGIGTFSSGAMLAAPQPLLLYHTGGKFPTEDIRAAYKASAAERNLRVEEAALTEEEALRWALDL